MSFGRFNPGEGVPGTYWTGGWVGPEPVWKWWWRENISSSAGNRTQVVHPIA